MPPSEIAYAFFHWSEAGWKRNGGKPVVDWKLTMRKWHAKWRKDGGLVRKPTGATLRPPPRFALVNHLNDLKKLRADLPANGDETVVARFQELTAQIEETNLQIASTPL